MVLSGDVARLGVTKGRGFVTRSPSFLRSATDPSIVDNRGMARELLPEDDRIRTAVLLLLRFPCEGVR